MKRYQAMKTHLLPIRALFFVALGFALVSAAMVRPAKAIEIREVVSPSGIKAWLVEDYTVPIISMSVEFTGGSNTDPAGLEGLTSFMTAMMDEGAGDLDTAALKAEVEERGIEIGFSTSRDNLSGGMRFVQTERDRAFELFSMMLNEPRFEAASLERIRAGFIASVKRSKTRQQSILGKAVRETIFPGHPYARPSRGDENSLAAITRDDIIAQHRRLLAKDNMFIGVVGAISPQELAEKLDQTFGALPAKSERPEISDIVPVSGLRKHIPFEGPQTLVAIVLPNLKRSHPDFFASFLVNHILGGGAFSSRLYDEIREKRGLVYGIDTSIIPLDFTSYLSGGFATASNQAGKALELTLEEIRRIGEFGPTEAELEAAKKFVFGSYAINNLDTSSKIADVLVGLQSSELGIDYIDTRREAIMSVTLEDAIRVAKELYASEPTVITIGPGEV